MIDRRCYESSVTNIVSISGGKDSLAQWLLAIEAGVNFTPVIADTGHEHPQTMEYLDYLEGKLGPIKRVKADFSARIEGKRKFIEEKWPTTLLATLMADVPGEWVLAPGYKLVELKGVDGVQLAPGVILPDGTVIKTLEIPSPPLDVYKPAATKFLQWVPARPGMSYENAALQTNDAIERALRTLHPTGNPFLDLCMWKGRFPSTKARFCTFELKHEPIKVQVVDPIIRAGGKVVSWQGVRAQESPARAALAEWEEGLDIGPRLAVYRPILQWTHDEVFALAKKHGIKPNPLYQQGCSRVGCMPCIHARKSELAEIFTRWPEEVQRVADWEKIVAACSRRGNSTFFPSTQDPRKSERRIECVTLDSHGIQTYRDWALTTRGGSQFDLFAGMNESSVCNSVYAGVCE